MTQWLVFFAVATMAAARKARALAGSVETLYEQWLVKLGSPRSDASSRRIAAQLPAEPIISVTRAAHLAQVSNTAADNAVRALESSGILRRLNAKKWGRLWEAPDVFALLDEFERELATADGSSKPARPVPRRG